MTGQHASVTIQVIAYNNGVGVLTRFLESVASFGRSDHPRVTLLLGDCSDQPALDSEQLAAMRDTLVRDAAVALRYTYFGENLGFGAAHNRLWRDNPPSDQLLIINPDTVPAFHVLTRLVRAAANRPDCGAVEARQIPIEHPKRFDPETLETDWVSGACCLIDGPSFTAVGGFDERFFLYCEDVDLSWRLRARGKKLYYCPETFVYHRKRLVGGNVMLSDSERFYGALSALLLRAKYGRPGVNERALRMLRESDDPLGRSIASAYDRQAADAAPADERAKMIANVGPDGEFVDARWTYPLPDR